MSDKEVLEEYIKRNFIYNQETGKLTRTDRKNSNGSLDRDGYLIVKIKGRQIKAHRLCWYLFYKKWPRFNIDHINRIRIDNRICNLRDVKQSVNNTNRTIKKNKKTGVERVGFDDKTKGLLAVYWVSIKNKTYRFRTLEEAIRKRDEHYKGI